MINVTQSFLPPIEEYTQYLQKSWDKNWITNRGSLLLELEDKLKDFLDVDYLTITTNGTLPLKEKLLQLHFLISLLALLFFGKIAPQFMLIYTQNI